MMTRYPWVLAVLSLAAMPQACTIAVITQPSGGTGASEGNGGGQGTGGGTPIPADQCNPVTGAGCPADGSACDLAMSGGYFQCFPPPNTVGVCGVCDGDTLFCGANLTCVEAPSA